MVCGALYARSQSGGTPMTDREAQIREMAKKLVVYRLDGMDDVTVRRDLPYKDALEGALVFDLYEASHTSPGVRPPVVVIVMGYPDPTGLQFGFVNACADKSIDDLAP